MNRHVAGKPVSRGTYQRCRCRCVGCVAAEAAWKREWKVTHPDRYAAQQERLQAAKRAKYQGRYHRLVSAESVEQALARGDSTERIQRQLGVSAAKVQESIDYLNSLE